MADPNDTALSVLEKILVVAVGAAYTWGIWVTTMLYALRSKMENHQTEDELKHEAMAEKIDAQDKKQLTHESVRQIVDEALDKREKSLGLQIEHAVQRAMMDVIPRLFEGRK